MPGGANGVLVKSRSPLIYAYADNDGLIRDPRRRLRVIVAWAISKSHKPRGNAGSVEVRPARTWFLNVRIARSVVTRQWT